MNELIKRILEYRKTQEASHTEHDISKCSFEEREDAVLYFQNLGLESYYDERTNLLTVQPYEKN